MIACDTAGKNNTFAMEFIFHIRSVGGGVMHILAVCARVSVRRTRPLSRTVVDQAVIVIDKLQARISRVQAGACFIANGL